MSKQQQLAAERLETVDISTLIPDPDNVRKHSEENIEAIKRSLVRFKQRKPIIIDADSRILAGNGTYIAATALGYTHLKAIRYTDLTGDEAMAYAIADNRTAELARWDFEALGKQMERLTKDANIPSLDMGWSEGELANIIGSTWTAPPVTGTLDEFTPPATEDKGAPAAAPQGGTAVPALQFSAEQWDELARLCGTSEPKLMADVIFATMRRMHQAQQP